MSFIDMETSSSILEERALRNERSEALLLFHFGEEVGYCENGLPAQLAAPESCSPVSVL